MDGWTDGARCWRTRKRRQIKSEEKRNIDHNSSWIRSERWGQRNTPLPIYDKGLPATVSVSTTVYNHCSLDAHFFIHYNNWMRTALPRRTKGFDRGIWVVKRVKAWIVLLKGVLIEGPPTVDERNVLTQGVWVAGTLWEMSVLSLWKVPDCKPWGSEVGHERNKTSIKASVGLTHSLLFPALVLLYGRLTLFKLVVIIILRSD